eukprot:SM000144S00703  [mRNA]  locus=s144:304396:307167:- [translate_table: standard]
MAAERDDGGGGGDGGGVPRCPLGYSSASFRIGPLSCAHCKALLFDACRCRPCRHIFCRGCLASFRDCPLCGADIDGLEPHKEMQAMVDKYIAGHARRQRSTAAAGELASESETRKLDKDAALERGSLLLQQAMRAFQAQNFDSARSRLELCVSDLQAELAATATQRPDDRLTLSCQLGAVLGSLGDCCRITGEMDSAAEHYQEAVNVLVGLDSKDKEVAHTLSVSLNKLGDLRYHAGDLAACRGYYEQALHVRREALECLAADSQVLDVAVSLAKVADVDRALGEDQVAAKHFREAASVAKELATNDEALKAKRDATLEFILTQISAGAS